MLGLPERNIVWHKWISQVAVIAAWRTKDPMTKITLSQRKNGFWTKKVNHFWPGLQSDCQNAQAAATQSVDTGHMGLKRLSVGFFHGVLFILFILSNLSTLHFECCIWCICCICSVICFGVGRVRQGEEKERGKTCEASCYVEHGLSSESGCELFQKHHKDTSQCEATSTEHLQRIFSTSNSETPRDATWHEEL